MLKDGFKLIDGKDAEQLNALCKAYQKFEQLAKEYSKSKNDSYADIKEVICKHCELDDIESQGKYQTLKFSVEFKKASETTKVDEKLLKEKYPQIYAEVLKTTVSKPALKEIVEIKV